MVELHIYLEPEQGKEDELLAAFRNHFVPAIEIQKGFRSVAFLKPHDSLRGRMISLRFESEELRQKWATSKEHDEAFPRVAAICSSVSWRNHDVVESR
jgi:heme-degrading monooxygenase HmoA